jgi:hypothetical protein
MRPGGPALHLLILAPILASCLRLPDRSVEQRDRPPLLVTEANIIDRQENVPLDIRVRLVFNQPLDPVSLDATEITLESGALVVQGRKKYDLMTRALTFEPNATLRPNLWYTYRLVHPPYSIMGSAPADDEIALLFRTGDETGDDPPPDPPMVDFGTTLFPVFSGNCYCHSQVNPLLGAQFSFETPGEFLHGAVAVESKEWRNWQIIHPGSHEKSYLMYKLLGDDRLGFPTITGETMPPLPDPPLPIDTIGTIKTWIEQGAGSGVAP